VHFLTLLDDRFQKIRRAKKRINIKFRGYNPETWVPDGLSGIELPVYAIAYNICPTFRDIYLEFVQGIRRMPTWERYKGKMIDYVYKTVHKKCASYITSSTVSINNFDLQQYLLNELNNILSEAKREFRRELAEVTYSSSDVQVLDDELKKIVKFEALITAGFMNFQVSKVRNAKLARIFDQYFSFNTDLPLCAPHQGFRADATPDFIYRNNVIGDIKSGKWQEFFYYTIAAYALAYEEHANENIDYGAILHVETSRRPMPLHYRTRIELIDDSKRERCFVARNRKLEIVHDKVDPGLPSNSENCDPSCSFFSNCWGNDD
jgi:CRISPR-associated protein Cas4/Csa1 subtype I-A